MSVSFAHIRMFFSDLRSSRSSVKSNKTDVLYLDPTHSIVNLKGLYDPDTHSVDVAGAGIIKLSDNSMFTGKKGRKTIIASYNSATAFSPLKDKQDYLTKEQVDALMKSGMLTSVLKPNVSMMIVAFILGIATAAIFFMAVMGVSFL